MVKKNLFSVMKRAIVVASMISLGLLMLWFLPSIAFNTAAALIILLTLNEFYSLMNNNITKFYCYFGLFLGGALLALFILVSSATSIGLVLPVTLFLLLSVTVLKTRNPSFQEFHALLIAMFGIIYIVVMLGQLIFIRNMTLGRELAMLLIVVVGAREVGAALGGYLFPQGKPINRNLNPKKSYAGVAMGIGSAIIASTVFSYFVRLDMTMFQAVLFGCCLGLACQLGDLSESYLKRFLDRRHSSGLFGPQGGLLDSLDALAFAVVVAHLFFY